ncbi:ATP-binding protein [Pararhizobium sp. BT-229]|uniref:ATP-binding protein n=1 Tax=Pararhizobium sp. BT-229 TaxID=2986923 RepID=UPI0021F6B514|nr:ATP-binding protein [Pararhizobium sp. BT-229]MCV9963539.1 ATP-binding protein [Pararhizobium sp. BT-229]
MTKYIRQGRDWFAADSAPDFKELLPVGTYLLNHNQAQGYYLSEVEGFRMPAKTYGKEIGRHNRIITTFLSRPAGTGVILAGEKGAGKTLLSKRVSIELAAQHGIPTIIINAPHCGDEFNQFIQSITQPALVILDEFEKVYGRDAQNSLLTVLDGTMQSKKLFIVAINDVSKMNQYMLNRPGRFFYVFNYAGVSEDAIREFLEDNLNDKTRIDSVVAYTQLFRNFTFDMLSAVVEEMNRYDEPVREVLKYINVSTQFGGGDFYEVIDIVFKKLDDENLGWDADSIKERKSARAFNDGGFYNPLQDEVSQIVFHRCKNSKGEIESDYEYHRVTPDDIVKMEKGGYITFDTEDLTMRIGKKPREEPKPIHGFLD